MMEKPTKQKKTDRNGAWNNWWKTKTKRPYRIWNTKIQTPWWIMKISAKRASLTCHLVHHFVVPPSHKWSRSSAIVGCHQKASRRTCLVQINSTTLQPIHTQQKIPKVHEIVNEVRWWFQVHILLLYVTQNSQLHWEILIRRPWKNQQTNHWQNMQQKLHASSISFLRLKNMMQSPARLPFQWGRKLGIFCLTQWKQYTPVSKRETIFGIWYQKHIWCSTKSILLSDLLVNPLATKLVKNSGFPTEDRPVTD